MSIGERASVFRRHFPAKNLSETRLQRIYRKYNIKFKKVKNTKILSSRQRRRIKNYIPHI